jgi:class 3 adenylate cyclase
MQGAETRYARSGDLRIAYQQFGDGPPLLLIPPLVSHIEIAWENELYRRVLEYFGQHVTCVDFDKRGIGLSDRPEEMPTLEERTQDLLAVMDAVGWERANVFGLSEGGAMAQLFAAEHADRVEHLVLADTFAPARYLDRVLSQFRPTDPPILTFDELAARFGQLIEGWPENPEYFTAWFMPSQTENESFLRWVGRLQRMAAGNKDFARQVATILAVDAGDAPERIQNPTLVMHVTGDKVVPVAHGRALAELIPNARYEEIPGEDHFLWVMPNWREIAQSIIEFVTGTSARPVTERRFGTVLFTDIVDSTKQSATLGDAQWRAILNGHDRLARTVIDRHGGRVIKSTGDGLLAVFDVPSQGVACGISLCEGLAEIGVQIRAGVHAGEIEVHEDGDISGIAVNLAARVEQHARGGELWASSTVRDMMLGGAATFTDRGEHELKGIDGTWRLFSVR